MVTRSHPWRRSRTAHSSSATAVCNPSPPALSRATSAPPAARPRLSPTPPADTTNPSTRDARYFASGASSLVASKSGASLSNAVAGAAHEAALVSVSGAATRRASRAGGEEKRRQRSLRPPSEHRRERRRRRGARAVDLLRRLFQQSRDDLTFRLGVRGRSGGLRGGERRGERLHRRLANPRPHVAAIIHAVILGDARQQRRDGLAREIDNRPRERRGVRSIRIGACFSSVPPSLLQRLQRAGHAAHRAHASLGVARLGVLLGNRRDPQRVQRDAPRRRRFFTPRRGNARQRLGFGLTLRGGIGIDLDRREQQRRGHRADRRSRAAPRRRVGVLAKRRRELGDEALRPRGV